MEVEDVSKQIEWDARRLVAAFEVENLICWQREEFAHFAGDCAGSRINWGFNIHTGQLLWLEHGRFAEGAINFTTGGADVNPEEGADAELIARGLYRFGFEDERVLSKLPALSAHEKMELRLSMPREFWPQWWRGEEAE